MIQNIFREYDIRGIFGSELNETSVKAIGFELGKEIANRGLKKVSVGYDARLSANSLFESFVSGLNHANLQVFNIGLLPTPIGYFSVFTNKFDANIMITGSHNPKEYNGFKITLGTDSFFGKDLQNLGKKVAKFIASNEKIPTNAKVENFDILSDYLNFFEKEFANLKDFDFPFVIDCANGAAGVSVEQICKRLNLKAKILFSDPDGNFPNHHPDPSEEKNLADLKNEMAKNGYKICGIDEPLLIYRIAKSSKSSNKLKAARMNWNTYRYVGLNPLAASYYMCCYTVRGLLKYRHLK